MAPSKYICISLALLITLICSSARCEDIPLIDAHSQMAAGLDVETIIPLMDEAGVYRTILSARNDRSPSDVFRFATEHEDRITAAIRTKGKEFDLNSPKFYGLLKKQLANPAFSAMGEVLLFHAQKGKKAPEIAVFPDEPQAVAALNVCLKRGWPFIAHIEFASAKGKRTLFMEKFEAMLAAHPDHPFALIHMGQLGPEEAGRLLRAHGNLYFLTSHCNPVSLAKNSNQPWSNLFSGTSIAPQWRKLMETYPDRFILAFDNVWADDWGNFYLDEAKVWQAALSELPPDLAHAVAHKNAERLWKLEPVQ